MSAKEVGELTVDGTKRVRKLGKRMRRSSEGKTEGEGVMEMTVAIFAGLHHTRST